MDQQTQTQQTQTQDGNQQTQQTQQTDANQQQQQTQQQQTQEPDIVTRVSQLKEEVKPVENFEGFDYKEIEAIQDPAAREQAMNAYKSFQRGFNKKFQELADIKKSLETQGTQKQTWTPETIQELLQDPTFVQSAQAYMQQNQSGGQLTDNEWSALTDSEKKQFSDMQKQVQMMTQQNTQLMQQRQDEQLKTRYANYDAQVVNSLTQDLLQGKYQATREDIWKVYDYEPAVKRAYELGKQDRQLDLTQKQDATSSDGVTVTPTNDVPARNDGESQMSYFKRLATRRLNESKGSGMQR